MRCIRHPDHRRPRRRYPGEGGSSSRETRETPGGAPPPGRSSRTAPSGIGLRRDEQKAEEQDRNHPHNPRLFVGPLRCKSNARTSRRGAGGRGLAGGGLLPADPGDRADQDGDQQQRGGAGGKGDGRGAAVCAGAGHGVAPFQLFPALAGSMSQTAQPVPRGVRVTAKLAVAWVVPRVLVMTCRTVTATVTEPGVRSRICPAVAVAVATCRVASRWARTPGVPAAWARAGRSSAAAWGSSRASQAAGDWRQDQESQLAVNRPARTAAACSRAGLNGKIAASAGVAAGAGVAGGLLAAGEGRGAWRGCPLVQAAQPAARTAARAQAARRRPVTAPPCRGWPAPPNPAAGGGCGTGGCQASPVSPAGGCAAGRAPGTAAASWPGRSRGPGCPAGSHAAPAGPPAAWAEAGVAVSDRDAGDRPGRGEQGAELLLPVRAGGQPEQDRGGDLRPCRQLAVPGELGGDPGQVFGAGVVLEEEVGARAAGVAPQPVPVGAGQVAPRGGAAPFGPPAGQLAAAAAGGCGERGEEAVGPDGVGQAGGEGDVQGAVAAVAEPGQGHAVLGGEHLGAGLVQDPVVGGAAGGGQRPEPVDGAEPVQLAQPQGRPARAAVGQGGDLGGGQDPVFQEHAQQPPVPGGEPPGQRGQQRGADRGPGRAAPGAGRGEGGDLGHGDALQERKVVMRVQRARGSWRRAAGAAAVPVL